MKHISFFLLLSTLLLVSSCRRRINPDDLKATEDMALAENLFSDAFTQVSDAAKNAQDSLGKIELTTLNTCATLSISSLDTVTWPKTLTLDFGTTNCLGNDLRYRRGKIIAVVTGWWRNPGTTVTVTFDQYFVNDHQILGTKTITNEGRNSANHLVYHIHFPDGQIIKPNGGGTVTWQTDREHEWIEGENTLFNPWDDVYLIRGTAGGTSANGTNYSLSTVIDLNVKIGCRWIRAGELDFDIQNVPTITINFGNGTCDAFAKAYFQGNEYDLVMW
jgi:hypothetical protein